MRFELMVFRPATGLRPLVLDAVNEAAAREGALRDGYSVLSVTRLRNRETAWRRDRFDLPLFCQELLALIEAGMTLVEAFGLLANRARTASGRAVLQQVLAGIQRGESVSRALDAAPDAFSPLFVASIRASERSGALTNGVRSFLAYQRSLDAVRNKVVSASVYPCILLVAGVLVVVFLLSYVVPRFSVVYAGLDQTQLPLMSQLLMQWGQAFSAHSGAIFAAFLGCLLVFAMLARLPAVRAAVQRWLWQLPRLGEQIRTYQLARFTRTLALLLKGGETLPSALGLSGSLLRQAALQEGVIAAKKDVDEGQGLADAFHRHGLATEVGVRLLSVGERSGALDQTMERIAAFYDDENARQIDLFLRTFEPLLMVFMGLVIGGIVILMYLPIFQLANSIQ
ncbi:type II secretion system F family protein [Pseudorhodoferax sp. Leaf265]|uniref:type II secretion system F family protein n=1 Tax=Pseudorhodoferax sp. Leaf265 TaxID=1736315 RepID=UPI0007015097|nr:type II secretion system F family protein [Pseudorhodoferax sp. Leaf265]KQP17029.1 type II secretion system protein [Pseudorhodoferax sp. Leaf265]